MNSNDQDIQSTLEGLPMSEQAPSDLKARLRQLALQPPTRHIRKWPSMPTFAFAGLAAAGIVIAMTLAPTHAVAKSWTLLKQAVQDATGVQFAVTSHSNHKEEHVTIVASHGKVAVRASDALVLIDGGKITVYDPKKNEAQEIVLPAGIDSKMITDQVTQGLTQGMHELSLQKMISDFENKYGKDHIKISPIHSVDGRDVYEANLDSPEDGSRVQMVVDANSDLPRHIHVTGPKEEDNVDMDLRFNDQIDQSAFDMTIPAGAKVNHMDFSKMNMDFSKADGFMKNVPPSFFEGMGGHK